MPQKHSPTHTNRPAASASPQENTAIFLSNPHHNIPQPARPARNSMADNRERQTANCKRRATKIGETSVPPILSVMSCEDYSSSSFMFVKTFVTSSSSSSFSTNLLIDSRCSAVTSLVSVGMRTNSPLTISNPLSSRYFCTSP